MALTLEQVDELKHRVETLKQCLDYPVDLDIVFVDRDYLAAYLDVVRAVREMGQWPKIDSRGYCWTCHAYVADMPHGAGDCPAVALSDAMNRISTP